MFVCGIFDERFARIIKIVNILHNLNFFRYYTKFFGNEGIAGPNIATYGLMSYKKWEQDITDWQLPIVDDEYVFIKCFLILFVFHPFFLFSNLPDWLKSALMNELYYIADGGTVWFDVSDQYPVDDPRLFPVQICWFFIFAVLSTICFVDGFTACLLISKATSTECTIRTMSIFMRLLRSLNSGQIYKCVL